MEAILLLILMFLFGIGCLIATTIYSKFEKFALPLIVIYLLGIFIGIEYLKSDYKRVYGLNSLSVPFTNVSGNEVKFNFIPQYDGDYTVDIAFLNKDINQKYNSCDFIFTLAARTIRRSEQECKNARMNLFFEE